MLKPVNGAIQTAGAVGRIPAFQDTSGVKLFLETLFVSSHKHGLKQPKIIVKPTPEKPVSRGYVKISVLHAVKATCSEVICPRRWRTWSGLIRFVID